MILVHPWGIDDGQGWKNPQASNCYGYAFMGLHKDNLLCLDHLKDVVRPLVQSLRGRLPVVAYSLPGSPDAVRGKIYRDYTNLPDPAVRAQAQKELEAYLNSLSGKQWPKMIPVSRNLSYHPSSNTISIIRDRNIHFKLFIHRVRTNRYSLYKTLIRFI